MNETPATAQAQWDRLSEGWSRAHDGAPLLRSLTFDARAPRGAARQSTVLVVEDAEDDALLVSIAARRARPDLDVRFAANGREAIAYLAGWPPFHDRDAHPVPDLVMLDLEMPGLHGFDVLRWIRDRRHPLFIPTIVLTGSRKQGDAREALRLGALAVYRKPSTLDRLGGTVSEIVRRWLGGPTFSWVTAT